VIITFGNNYEAMILADGWFTIEAFATALASSTKYMDYRIDAGYFEGATL